MLQSLSRLLGTRLNPAAADCDARKVQQALAKRLIAGDDVALRLRAGLHSRAKGTVCTLTIGLWVDERGFVTKSSFAPFANRQATRDLKHLLQNLRLTPGEPNGMLLSVRIKLIGFELEDVSGIECDTA